MKGKSMVVRKRAFSDETDRRPSLKDIAFARRWTRPCDLDSHVERNEVAFAGETENVIWDANGTKRDDDYNRGTESPSPSKQRAYNSVISAAASTRIESPCKWTGGHFQAFYRTRDRESNFTCRISGNAAYARYIATETCLYLLIDEIFR